MPAVAEETLYVPDRIRKLGWRVWNQMFRDLLASRDLIWRLFVRDWTAQYRQSWLGYLWAVAPAVVTVAAFSVVRRHVLPHFDTPVPYVLYGLWGASVWQLFAGCYNAAAQSLSGSGTLVARINFPKDALVFSSLGKGLFEFMVRLALLAGLFACYRTAPAWTAVFLPVAILPILLMALGMGLIVSVVTTAGTDLSNAIVMALNFGMLVTPGVLYPAIERWPAMLLNWVNPLSPVLIATHDLLERGCLTAPGAYAAACLFSILLFLVGWRFFCLALPRVAERF